MAVSAADMLKQLGPTQQTSKPAAQGGVSAADMIGMTGGQSSSTEDSGTLSAISDAFKSVKDNAFVKRSTSALRTAADAVKDNPAGALNATGDALFAGAVDMINLSMSGVAALAKTMFDTKVDAKLSMKENFDKSIAQFTANQQKIKLSLDGVNNAPPDKQQEAMQGVLGILPDAINSAGDTVFEKTGSALLGAGAVGLLTVLSLNPEIAGKVLNKASDVSRTKGINTKVSASFEELAATNSKGAEAIANHIEIVDSKAAQYIRGRIEALKDADETTLDEIGKRKADAEIAELQKNLDDIVRTDNANLDPALSTGEGKGKRTRSKSTSAPSGYSELGIEQPPEPEVGLSTGEGVASKSRSRTKSAPSRYGEIVDQDYAGTSGERYDETIKGKTGPAPVEEEYGLGTGEGKASKARRGSRSGPSGYGANLVEPPPEGPPPGAVITPERMSASLRNAVMEGHDALRKVGAQVANDTSGSTTKKSFLDRMSGGDAAIPSVETLHKRSGGRGYGQTPMKQPETLEGRIKAKAAGESSRQDAIDKLVKSGALTKEEGEAFKNNNKPEGLAVLYTVNDVPVTRDDFGRFSNLDNFWDCT